MGISLSILLVAIGAILTWAVSAEVQGVDIQAVGVIREITSREMAPRVAEVSGAAIAR